MNPYDIIFHPYVSEKSSQLVETENALEFVVRRDASKKQIKKAIEKMYNVKVTKVNTRITLHGKKALVKLSSEFNAGEIGSRIGIY
jgi:large subunit ribosomal protein L23